jgi:hypothetical protein
MDIAGFPFKACLLQIAAGTLFVPGTNLTAI